MIEEIIKKLERSGCEDFDTSRTVTKENINIAVDSLGMVKIYLPQDYEYSQYDIEDFIRRNFGLQYKTVTTPDRNLYVQEVKKSLGAEQIVKLIEFIVSSEDFCTLIVD